MSVVVRKGDVLAVDSHANSSGRQHDNSESLAFPYPKLWAAEHPRLQVPALFAAVGPLQAVARLQQWVETGMKAADMPSNSGAQLLVLTKEKGLQRYKNSATPYLHGSYNYAIGEGAPFAYGALFMKATAEEAVAAAIDGSPFCNGSVISLSL